ncbi:MAG: signal peptidase II [Jatrophihabitans sp.]|uniref:signal peptidase II n=1 Tax=Jatrophihabitans sp. TaxID=1932789 RepID=UPI003F81CD02
MSSPDTDTPPASPSGVGRPRRIVTFLVAAVLALLADVLSKIVVVSQLPDGKQERILGGAIYLQQARNSGAAFSVGTGFTIVLTVVAVAVVVVILRQVGKLRSRGWAVSLGLILGGALGNLGDRIFRAPSVGRGHVVDWISLFGPDARYWPIFNLADSAVVIGAVLAAVLALLNIDLTGTRRHG